MAMNIKNGEAHKLASELARLRQVTVTQAVTDALRNDLERQRHTESRAGLAAELLRIGRRCAEHVGPGVTSGDHADMLYDEQGLPR